MRRRIGVTVIALVSVLILTTITAWALIMPTKVLALKAYQFFPYSNGTYLTYSSNSTQHPSHVNAYARRFSDGKTVRINALGTAGFDGGFDPGTDTVIYQQVKNASSDIYSYNLDTRVRQKLGVLDTKQWEWDPRISSTYTHLLPKPRLQGGDVRASHRLQPNIRHLGLPQELPRE
jgi:hypothetical protein